MQGKKVIAVKLKRKTNPKHHTTTTNTVDKWKVLHGQ